jgi:hypothetical protein
MLRSKIVIAGEGAAKAFGVVRLFLGFVTISSATWQGYVLYNID